MLQDSWKGCEYRETVRRRNGDMIEKVEMAACVVGRGRDYIRCSLANAMLPLEELNFRVTV